MSKNSFDDCELEAGGDIRIGDDVENVTVPSQESLELPPIEMAEQGIPFEEAVALNRQRKYPQGSHSETRVESSRNHFEYESIRADGDIHIGDDISNVTYDYASYDRAIYKKNYYEKKSQAARGVLSSYYHLLKIDLAMVLVALLLVVGWSLQVVAGGHGNTFFALVDLVNTIASLPCTLICTLAMGWWIDDFPRFFADHERIELLMVGLPLLAVFGYRLCAHFKQASDVNDYDDYCEHKVEEAQNDLLK